MSWMGHFGRWQTADPVCTSTHQDPIPCLLLVPLLLSYWTYVSYIGHQEDYREVREKKISLPLSGLLIILLTKHTVVPPWPSHSEHGSAGGIWTVACKPYSILCVHPKALLRIASQITRACHHLHLDFNCCTTAVENIRNYLLLTTMN